MGGLGLSDLTESIVSSVEWPWGAAQDSGRGRKGLDSGLLEKDKTKARERLSHDLPRVALNE